VLYDGIHAYVYDAENRLAMVDAGMSYIYDAEGRRVGKSDGTVYTVDGGGNVLDEVDGATWKRSEVYLGGHHLATVNSTGVIFVHSDWTGSPATGLRRWGGSLGTERARTNMAGVVCETITSQPFGDNVHKTGSCDASPDFFTGKPRDAESNLDDFGARYFSSQWGRWMSADWTAAPSAVPYATLTNLQSLNLYAYVGNDPIDGQDADGHALYVGSDGSCAGYGDMCGSGGYGSNGGQGGPSGAAANPASDPAQAQQQIPRLVENVFVHANLPPEAKNPKADDPFFALSYREWQNEQQRRRSARYPQKNLSNLNGLLPAAELQERFENWTTNHVVIPAAMVTTGVIVAGSGVVATTGLCATVVGCLLSPITAGVALSGAGLALEGVYYAFTQKFWVPGS
jgi:RHS repeat-associated protein